MSKTCTICTNNYKNLKIGILFAVYIMEQYLKKMAVIDRNKNSITLSNGSIIEIPFEIEDDVSIEELNKILKEYLDKLNILDEEE